LKGQINGVKVHDDDGTIHYFFPRDDLKTPKKGTAIFEIIIVRSVLLRIKNKNPMLEKIITTTGPAKKAIRLFPGKPRKLQ
jgi:hypothetical protein